MGRRKRSDCDESDSQDSEKVREMNRKCSEELDEYIEREREKLTRLLTEFPEETKLTRRKARELDLDLINVLKLGGYQTEENSSLLEEDYDEDEEEDDEYHPEDDYHSDELETTCSDIDSQPRTPANQEDPLNTTQYDEEGVFKLPGEPPKTPKQTADEMISRRTRSKISLAETPIEAIQQHFVAPDVTGDIDDSYVDLDESWQEFLKEFQMPLNALDEEEEETDPEYVAPGRDTVDVDEIEDIPITKDEVHALLDGLLDEAEEEEEDEENENNKLVQEKSQFPVQEQTAYENTLYLQSSVIQPTAIIHTNPPLAPKYELVLATDEKMYVLPRNTLREIVPGIRFRRHVKELTGPTITVDVTGDPEDLIEEIREHKEAFEDKKREEQNGFFSDFNLRRLQIQMIQHIQLLGQCFMQTHGHPEMWSSANFFLKKLNHFRQLSETSQSIFHLCWNARDMYKRCIDWQNELSVDSEENKEYVEWCMEDHHVYKFHPRLMEHIVSSKAFVFSHMLPRTRINNRRHFGLRESEKNIILFSFQKLKEKRPDLSFVECARIYSKHYAPWRLPRTIIMWFRRKKCDKLKFFLKTGAAPEVIPETMEYLSYDDVLEPAQRNKWTLPTDWNAYVFSKERILRVYRDLVQPHKTDIVQSEQLEAPQPKRLKGTEEKPLVCLDFKNFKAEFHAPEKSELSRKSQFISGHQTTSDISDRRDTGRSRLKRRKLQNLIERLIDNKPKKSKSLERIRTAKRLSSKFNAILDRFSAAYDGELKDQAESSIPKKIFNYLKEFDIFVRLVAVAMKDVQQEVQKRLGAGMEEENPTGPTVKRVKLDEEALIAKRTLEMNRRYQKAQRMQENNRLLLQPEADVVGKERDSLFCWNYFYKVQNTFLAEGRPEKYEEFVSILKNFKPKDTVPRLYQEMENLFLPDHRELLELFLSMLLPGHAAQLGQFFEHSLLNNLESFVAKLKVYFEKQPNQWKKILTVLNELVSEDGVNMATIKQRFLPLLKGNPLLIDWFVQLFPTERPPDAQENEFEELQTKQDLPFEVIPGTLIQSEGNDTNTPSCAIKYMQGRIQYGNRYILPADLSFLATSYELTGEEKAKKSPTTTTKKTTKRGGGKNPETVVSPAKSVGCVHEVSPVWEEGDDATCSQPKEPLCDVATLRAHMLRLNPPVTVENTQDDPKVSPKKSHEWKTIPITAKVKVGGKQGGSPKKGTASGSPKKGQETKRRKTVAVNSSEVQKEEMKPVEDVSGESQDTIEWTREEDKIILEAVNGQKDTSEEEILDQLCLAIPSRSRSAIGTRFQFIINVLKKFA